MAGISPSKATSPLSEDSISVITSKLEGLDRKSERSLKELEEIKEVLHKIEGNTDPDVNGRSVGRKYSPKKVRLTIKNLQVGKCLNKLSCSLT